MSLSDPIADMLNRLRNAHSAGKDVVTLPASRFKCEIIRILKREGYINDFALEGAEKKTVKMYLKYSSEGESAIRGLQRISRPGYRRYVTWQEIPRVLGGMGTAVVSTSKGLMTDKEAREKKVGGELLCKVW